MLLKHFILILPFIGDKSANRRLSLGWPAWVPAGVLRFLWSESPAEDLQRLSDNDDKTMLMMTDLSSLT